MANKVTIFGAGSVVFSLGLVKDLCLTKELDGSHVCFMDINEEVLDVIYELGRRYAEDLGASLTFEKTTDRLSLLRLWRFRIAHSQIVPEAMIPAREQ